MIGLTSFRAGATIDSIMKEKAGSPEPLLNLSQIVMRGDSELTYGQRELIAAYVSGLNACGFCFGSHKAFAESWGVDGALMDQMMADLETAPLDPKLRAILAYCRKLVTNESALTESDRKAVLSAGWSEQALLDAIWVTALFCLYNKLADGVGLIPRPDEHNRLVAQFVKPIGYDFEAYQRVQADSKSDATE